MLDAGLFNGRTRLSNYSELVWRVVESQETAATLNIVDTMQEQDLLEALLDDVKPNYRQGTQGMHYLLKTAFRYPPLQYGSRFGTRTMPSYFYASEVLETAFAETAYYRFLFLSHLESPYHDPIDSAHTAFSVSIRSNKCLDLLRPKFQPVRPELVHKSSYSLTQLVGAWAVEQRGAELIRFESARAVTDNGKQDLKLANANLAVAEPGAISSRKPRSQESWLCRTSAQQISFSSRSAKKPLLFNIDNFLVDGGLPRVA